jgi:1A family penicillin-binding protein
MVATWTALLTKIGSFLQFLGRPIFYLFIYSVYAFLVICSTFGHLLLRILSSLYKKSSLKIQKITQIKIAFKRPHFVIPKIPKTKIIFPVIKRSFVRTSFLKLIIFIFLLFFLGLSLFYGYLFITDLPDPNQLSIRKQALTTKIYDRNGELLYKIYRNQNRTLVKLEDIPLPLQEAIIAIEDAEFYSHHGLSLKGISRAAAKIFQNGKLEGGSTITQQLVKNTLLTPERSLQRKIKEALLALMVEQHFTKSEILQMYLNEVGFGGSTYGVEEAAQVYFGKKVQDLNLAESALLAGLPASPTTYSPFGANPQLAKERQIMVLNRMVQESFITPDDAQKAQEENLNYATQIKEIKAPHFVMYVKEKLVQKYGENLVEEGGLEVITTLDITLQNKAEQIVNTELEKVKNLHIQNGAVLVTKPDTGEILVMVGSKNYFDLSNQGNYNVTTALRQPGSSIKPVNYAVALSMGFTPATMIPDTPITYQVPGQPPYSPANYDNKFRGNVSLRTALGSSLNVPAVKVLSAIGVSRMLDQGKKMGITSWDDYSRFGLSLTLGGGEVKMTDMAVVYGALANLGTKAELVSLLEVKDGKGKIYERFDPKKPKALVLDPNIAFLLNNILSDNEARTPIFGSRSLLVIPGKTVAAKTGTTNNLRDNWAIGYTPSFVVLSWVGNNDSSPMSRVTSGVSGATPIWHQVMVELLKNQPNQSWTPTGEIIRIEICPTTGTLPCNGCNGKWEYFLKGTEPKNACVPEEKPTN